MNKSGARTAFPIVAIGASAGGLKAFEELLNALPRKPGMAFVLVPHLAPQFKSHLTEILGRSTRLPVREIKGGDRVLSDQIYILPPNREMLIKEGVLHLSLSGKHGSRPVHNNPIDRFFRALAEDQKTNAVGVLLSGAGSDGTEGLRVIKNCGGTTYAQDGETAAYLSMPQSAVVSGCVDFILSPAEIGKKLGLGPNGDPGSKKTKILSKDDGALIKILEFLRAAKGVDFELYKRSTLRRRIQRRMALNRLRDPEKYLRALKADPKEAQLLYDDILIAVTSFFREPESFRALKSTIYPRILKNRTSSASIRIWVPGCSTGEEAYSHAMNLAEFLGERGAAIPFQIFGTDVNPAVIEKARIGFYGAKAMTGVSPERQRRFFVRRAGGFSVVPSLRDRCVFAVQNLVQDPPFTNLDLISCRNLMIYFGSSLQEKAMQTFQYALKHRGILMLGRSETIGDFSGRFSPLDVKTKVFSMRTTAARGRLDFAQPRRFSAISFAFKDHEDDGRGQGLLAHEPLDLQAELDRVLPERYTPNGVVVNAELEIQRFLGNTSAYLRPAPGKPSLNLRRMASGELLLEIRAAIHAARKSACAVRKEIAAPQSNGASRRVRLEVLPIRAAREHHVRFLVLFEEISIAELDKPRSGGERRGKESRRVIELKQDLAVSGEHLKAIIEEQESTNARLKSSNEDLLSSNEELQSINEEYETTKEELQSSNEELIASSEEVERGNQILNRSNNDLSNFLANIDFPIVLLDADLTIHRFTLAAEKVLGLSAENIGRSIMDVGLPLHLPNLKDVLLHVIKTGSVQALEIQDARGHWYYLILRPYRTDKSKTEKSRTEGAVMALVDINERKLSEKTLLRLATLARDSNDAVIICDLDGRIIAWNKGAQKMYGYTEAKALRMNISRLMPKSHRIKPRELLRLPTTPIETKRRAKDGRILDVLRTVTVLRDDAGRPVEIAKTERDITEQKRAEHESRLLHARVILAQDTERKRIARELHDGVGQILSGVKYRLQALPGKMTLSGGAEAKILKVGGFLDHAIAEIRRVSQNLMPSELEDLGLEPALLALCREFKERSGVRVTVITVPMIVGPDLALALFRIAQEALNNIGKHSKATKAWVSLAHVGTEIVMIVTDNGIGFTPGSRRSAGRGIGLGNMRERAESVGGTLQVRSESRAGTTLSVRAPLSAGEGAHS